VAFTRSATSAGVSLERNGSQTRGVLWFCISCRSSFFALSLSFLFGNCSWQLKTRCRSRIVLTCQFGMASKLTVRNLHISWCAWLRRPKRSLKFFQRSQNTVQTRCITTTIGVGAGKFLGVRSIFARISPNLPEKILRAHFLQNVVNRGDLRLCGGDWHSNLTKISLIYSISYFNLGAWNFVWEGYAHQSPPPWRQDWFSPTKNMKTCFWCDLQKKVLIVFFCKHWTPFFEVKQRWAPFLPWFSGILPRFSEVLPKFSGISPKFSTNQNFWGCTSTPAFLHYWPPLKYIKNLALRPSRYIE